MSSTKLNGIINGMESMGAVFVKINETHLFFDIEQGSEIDNDEYLERSKKICLETLGIGLKVRRVKK